MLRIRLVHDMYILFFKNLFRAPQKSMELILIRVDVNPRSGQLIFVLPVKLDHQIVKLFNLLNVITFYFGPFTACPIVWILVIVEGFKVPVY